MKILLLEKIHPAGVELLEAAGFQIAVAENTTEQSLIETVGEYDAILVRAMIPITEAVIRAAKKCRIISRHGVGLDTIDVSAATRFGIPIAYTPGANANAVAEHTISLILDVMKHNCQLSRKLMQENNYACRLEAESTELRGKTLGLVGIGNIGSLVARIACHGFGCRILAYSRHATLDRFLALGVDGTLAKDLDELLENSDIVSLHLPGTQNSLIDKHALKKMKPGSILINTARGCLVNEEDLYDALTSGHLAGAGLDVTASEPPEQDNPLFQLENIVITPHTAALTREGKRAMAIGAAEQIVNYLLRQEKPWGFANPEVWEIRRT